MSTGGLREGICRENVLHSRHVANNENYWTDFNQTWQAQMTVSARCDNNSDAD